jgi:hypothetical protein
MPEEAAAGCLVGLLRFVAEFLLEWCGEWFLGHLGKWTLYLITLGRCDRDPEEGICIMTGLLMIIALIIAGVWVF